MGRMCIDWSWRKLCLGGGPVKASGEMAGAGRMQRWTHVVLVFCFPQFAFYILVKRLHARVTRQLKQRSRIPHYSRWLGWCVEQGVCEVGGAGGALRPLGEPGCLGVSGRHCSPRGRWGRRTATSFCAKALPVSPCLGAGPDLPLSCVLSSQSRTQRLCKVLFCPPHHTPPRIRILFAL